MPFLGIRDAANQRLLRRALFTWVLTRLLLVSVLLFALAMSAGAAPFGWRIFSVNPGGVALATGMVGLIDIRRRRERALWANLGMATPALFARFVAVAAIGEVVVYLVIA